MAESGNRRHEVRVRLTEQEHQQVRRAAAARSLPMAVWLRQLALAAAGRISRDAGGEPPSTRYEGAAMTTRKNDEQLKQDLLELARSGAPRPRLDSDDPEERELAEALIRFTTRPSDQDDSRS